MRKITPVAQSNYVAVPLDAGMLALTQSNFDDYRVYQDNDGDTAEVPYLFKWQDDVTETFTSQGNIIDRNYISGGTQYLTVEFPEQARVNQMELNISQSNFDKYVKIDCSNDNKNWKTIQSRLRIVGLNWWDAYYRSTILNFNESSFKYFRLTISNVDWSPYKGHMGNISIDGISITYNKCLSASFKKTEGLKISRKEFRYDPSEKNDTIIYGAFNELPPNPKAIRNRRTDFKNPLNPTELRIVLPASAYIHHIRVSSKDSGDFYRMCFINVMDNYADFKNNTGYIIDQHIFSSITNNTYNLGNAFGKYVLVKIYNYNNKELKDLDVEIYTQNARLICQLEQQKDYFVAYGKSNDYHPQYDLEYFQQKLPDSYNEVVLGPQQRAADAVVIKKEALIKNKMWLWIVMGVLIVFLSFFAFKLMKKHGDDEPENQ
ncbi:MAG: hypothetical protein IAF38_18825 [Bacteroidia bacterium]|nr:hypothetical protein [Bacteroidia bacterium]